jgi:hypothetical protein
LPDPLVGEVEEHCRVPLRDTHRRQLSDRVEYCVGGFPVGLCGPFAT